MITLEYAMIRGAADIAVVALNALICSDGQLAYTRKTILGQSLRGRSDIAYSLFRPDDSMRVLRYPNSPTDDVSASAFF